MLAIANVNQNIIVDIILKQDKSEGAMAPLDPIVATSVSICNFGSHTFISDTLSVVVLAQRTPYLNRASNLMFLVLIDRKSAGDYDCKS